MTTTWILVADSARARLFEADPIGGLRELECYANPEARAGTRGMTTDRPPTVNESVGSARHALEPHTSRRAKVAANFARTLRDVLEPALGTRRFHRLVLVAPARFLGDLHAAFGKPLRACVAAEVRRDFTHLSASELRSRLPAAALRAPGEIRRAVARERNHAM